MFQKLKLQIIVDCRSVALSWSCVVRVGAEV